MSAAADRAEALFREGAACSQAVLMALSDSFGVPPALASRLSLGLGGGVARSREICGAVTAMAMLAGLRYGADAPDDPAAKTRTYETARAMMEEFRARFGSCICRELLAARTASAAAAKDDAAAPSARTPAYYAARSTCLDNVRAAAEIAEKHLLQPEPEKP